MSGLPTEADAPRRPPEVCERWRALGYWTGETLGSHLRASAARDPDALAVADPVTRRTFGGLLARVDALAAGLHDLGLRRGDRVVVQLGNRVAFIEAVEALFALGALPVFALPAHRRRELEHFLAATDARAFIADDPAPDHDGPAVGAALAPGLPALERVLDPAALDALASGAADAPSDSPKPDDIAFLQLSGGSTGVPKLIPRTHDEYAYTLRRSAELCGLGTGSAYLAALPVAHNFALSSPGALGAIWAGATTVLSPSPAPGDAWPLIERERVTIAAAVPPVAALWLDAAAQRTEDLSSLEVLQVGGARLAESVARRVPGTLGCRLQQVFGMAEGLVCYTGLDDPEDRVATTQGRPMAADDELLVVDEEDRPVPAGSAGRLLTRGPYTINGYWRAPEHNARAFTPDGFYRTGDIVRITDNGDVVVEGRDKDQINRGGEKVAAEEVENVLLGHPGIADAALVAAPDPLLGERAWAFVVARPGAELTPAVVRRHVAAAGLARFKVPDRVVVVEQLPRTHVGKISKVALRARAAELAVEAA